MRLRPEDPHYGRKRKQLQLIQDRSLFFLVPLTAFPASLDFNAPLSLSTEVNGGWRDVSAYNNKYSPLCFRAGGIDSQAFAPSAATGGRMFYDTGKRSVEVF